MLAPFSVAKKIKYRKEAVETPVLCNRNHFEVCPMPPYAREKEAI